MNAQEAREALSCYLPPEVREQVIEAFSTNELQAYKSMETALQALAGQILSLRTELLVIKAEVTKKVEN